MALIPYPGTDNYSTITVSGLYDNNTESPLFAASGSTVPTSGLAIGGTNPSGNFTIFSLDQSANSLSFPGIQFVAGLVWNSGTTSPSFQYNNGTATEGPKTGAPAYVIQLDQSAGTFTGGAVTFQGTYDNINWVTIPVTQVLNPNTFAQLTNPYTFVTNTNTPFLILSQGYAQIRIELSTAITGTGTVTPYFSSLSYEPAIASSNSSTVTGTLSNNNAAPAANNLGVLGFVAETSYTTVTYTTGNQVLAVTDLHGAINNDMQAVAGVQLGATGVTAFGTAPAAANVQGVNASIYAGTSPLTATGTSLNVDVTGGTVAVTQSTTPWVVAGGLTNNNAAPAANNVGVLPAIAGAEAGQTYTSGDQVLLTTTTTGAVRTDQYSWAGTALGAPSNYGTSPGAVEVIGVNAFVTNTVAVAGTLTNNNAAPAANNVGVLPNIANGAAVGTAPTPETWTSGDQVLGVVTTGGSSVVIPADEYYASKINYFGADSGITASNPTGLTPILSIETNSATINFLIRSIQGMSNGALGVFRLFKNPTITGATFATTRGNMKIDTAGTAYSAQGTQVWSGYSGASSIVFQQMLQYMAAGATGDVFSLGWQKVGAGTANPYAAINWSEEAVVL